LTLECNDPNDPTVTVALLGEGLEPPIISVSPDSLYDSLAVGDTSVHSMTISNSGGNDLIFEISNTDSAGAGKAASFNGTDSWLESTDFTIPESFTVEMWVNPRTTAEGQSFIAKHSSTGGNILLIGYWSGGLQVRVRTDYHMAGPLTTGYYHLAVVVEKISSSTSEVTVYKDGSLLSQAVLSDVLGNPAGKPWVMGQDWDSQSLTDFFDGDLDEVRIWDHTRSLPEIQADMFRSLSGAEPGLVACWNFNRADPWADITGNGNDASARGGVCTVESEAPLAGWLYASPDCGIISPDSSMEVTVTMDARYIYGGHHFADILVHNNDPLDPVVVVPVHLRVTGIPDIHVAVDTMDFGGVFVGATVTDTLVVENDGTDLLTVTEVISETSEFAPEVTSFTVGPMASYELPVAFMPSTEGANMGALTVNSDDEDEPVVRVELRGEGLLPPVISVEPGFIHDTLFEGGESVHLITISNTGAADLVYSIMTDEGLPEAVSIDVIEDRPLQVSRVVGIGNPVSLDRILERDSPPSLSLSVGSGDPIDRDEPYTVEEPDADSYERITGEEVFGAREHSFSGSVRSRGNLFACTTSTVLIEHRLYMDAFYSMQMWFLVYEGDSPVGDYDLISASDITPAGPGEGWYSSGDINTRLAAGKHYLIVASFEGQCSYFNQQEISPYPIPASFGSLTGGAGWDWAPATSFPPYTSQYVPSNAYGWPVAYYQTLVTQHGVAWMDVEPIWGTVAPDSSIDILVSFDATGLHTGEFRANINISSNDPIDPYLLVPVTLNVIDSVCGITQLHPDTMYTFYANDPDSLKARAFLGDFGFGYTVRDIDPASMYINDSIAPDSTEIIPGLPGFVGDVMSISFPLSDFVAGYGSLFETTVQPYTVFGSFGDGVPFVGNGQFVLIGHRAGDANMSGSVDIDDVMFLVQFIFAEGDAPVPIEAGDADCSGSVDIEDIVYLVNHILAGGYAPCDLDGDGVPDL
jgi:hypothetical protein